MKDNPLGGKPAATISTKEQYDALPPGAAFTGSDGKQYIKPK
jgi:hypothetical protein